jgi:predicted nucleic acid-binding protein
MRRVFLDTSALVKLYRNEPNSALVRACLVTDDDLLISELTPLEFDAACLAWVRQGLVVEADARGRMSAFASDLPNYRMVEIRGSTWARARTLLDQFAISEGLRAPDALQAAAALDEHARTPIDLLVTTDSILARVAQAGGLIVKP